MIEHSEQLNAPRAETLQRWAFDYVSSEQLAHKIAPGSVPSRVLGLNVDECPPLRLAHPGRPPELQVSLQKIKAPRGGALRDPKKRAALLHTFWHHELQAAELMCWAVLAFPETPVAFKRGLIGICCDEIRHMQLYAAAIADLGFKIGDFPVRDWFWQRVPASASPTAFLAVMGLVPREVLRAAHHTTRLWPQRLRMLAVGSSAAIIERCRSMNATASECDCSEMGTASS